MFKFTSRKKLKARIAKLEEVNKQLFIERYELCENYNSQESLRIRLGHKIEKQMSFEIVKGNIEKDPVLKGIFERAQE